MFEREHHRRIATILEAMDAPLLAARHCYFGGGTAIALRYGEFRESVDIDFMVADADGYRELRQLLTGKDGLRPAMRITSAIEHLREVKADQYGIRTLLQVEGVPIKLEIVREARITFDPPGATDSICGLAAMTPLDMAASKLLANSDRWADDSVHSRDLIDLAMMRPKRALLRLAIDKARTAYGDSIERDLAKAVDYLERREGRLGICMKTMKMTVPTAVVWRNIKALRPAP